MTTTMPESLLSRVRGLLAKAESTEFEAEAEALNAKAAELIAKYGIDQALLAASGQKADEIGQLRIDIDSPYSAEKMTLLSAVAKPLRCRNLGHASGRTVTHCIVVGFESDLERVNLLYTSLLLQATSRLTSVRPGVSGLGHSRESVTAYRRQWLTGFAVSVFGRLEEAERRASAAADTAVPGMSAALVLRDRNELVNQHFAGMFPHAHSRPVSVRSGNGYRDGRAAGERADLGAPRVGGNRRALGR